MGRRLNLNYLGFVVLIGLSSCVTPLTDIATDDDLVLVVEGFITDEPGPHDVQVTFFNPINPNRRPLNGFPDAQVYVIDLDTDEKTRLLRKEVENLRRYFPLGPPSPPVCFVSPFIGTGKTPFQTPTSFQGILGHSYVVEIERAGQIYRSEPQLMLPTPEIDSLSLEFTEIPTVDIERPGSGVKVSVTWQDPPEENFYFWRVDGIYRIDSRYEEQPTETLNSGCVCAFDITDGGKDDCWIIENNLIGNEIAFADIEVNNRQVTLPVGVVEDDGDRFDQGQFNDPERLYWVEVEQYTMSEPAFLFQERIKILKEVNGEIFDPPPLSVRGNIHNVDDPEELVVGFFGAYSVKRADAFIRRDMIEYLQPKKRFFCGDCRQRAGWELETPEPFR